MDLTINAYKPVQRPVFQGDVAKQAMKLIVEAGKDVGSDLFEKAKTGNTFVNLEELRNVTDRCQRLKERLTTFMKNEFPDCITLDLHRDRNGDVTAIYKLNISGTYVENGATSCSSSMGTDNLSVIEIACNHLFDRTLPKHCMKLLLDKLMSIPSYRINETKRNEFAKQFATETHLLDAYNTYMKRQHTTNPGTEIERINHTYVSNLCSELDELLT